MFSKKADLSNNPKLDTERIPAHIAIIMDGNGRWAQARHLPRVAGHKQGMQTVKTVTMAASDLGVKVLTLYAFSTENWKRPNDEVSYLMQLPIRFFKTFVPDLVAHNVRVMVMGDISRLPGATQQAVKDAITDTSKCTGMILNFALNYGSRDEIVRAVKSIATEVQTGQLSPNNITEQTVSDHLMSSPLGSLADPDLLIRTSGEERISNFLLWQIAYSEFVFTDTYWPDFDGQALQKAIIEFQGRHRRFGGLKNN
ncbi:di-trans,poly-cis-decaprenylcistransferase [Limosilactobacillus frumenti DSM 13145]|uniref:Isoprenyl transferase n=1 Tax=Limosilactobacillus frumenti DSM 13145 TaxID=1423746 RepID=A0A0R1P348_9LACO|nr:isoprenyl transferase [Limosilactobacillus frumenti]KRL26990.1 di-trans,poly-cis-decaprenylcistransferase [Limosilactobacillus frumenti DSM 13145]MBA2914472.1 isoprenyl transferase [Limosilactobacillus frumenti]QFG72467.1 isoprenyl transferase [Limosilactobacillus frumenti]